MYNVLAPARPAELVMTALPEQVEAGKPLLRNKYSGRGLLAEEQVAQYESDATSTAEP
jgi:hypothetical protein